MELSPEEKKKIYEEEKARIDARAKIEAEKEKEKWEYKTIVAVGLTKKERDKNLEKLKGKMEKKGWSLDKYDDKGFAGVKATFKRILTPAVIKKKEVTKQIIAGVVFLLVILFIFRPFKTKEKPTKRPAQIEVRQEDILVNIKRDYIITQSYATNKGATDWKGSVILILKDEKGEAIYSSFDASWPTVTLKAGERDYRVHKIPKEKIDWAIPHIKAIKVVWKWGNIIAEKLVPIK